MARKSEQELLDKLNQMKTFENQLYAMGIQHIAGVDEVGRGPLAGPVVAAAVVLPKGFSLLGVDDSKKFKEKRREALYEEILKEVICYGIGIVDNQTIDEINILSATKKAMKEAIFRANESLLKWSAEEERDERRAKEEYIGWKTPGIEHLLIDALTLQDVEIPQTGIIKGDAKSVSIACASIIAKVTRDRMMKEYHNRYPDYDFLKNKGYGTKAHYAALDEYGTCPIHRMTFLRKYFEQKQRQLHA